MKAVKGKFLKKLKTIRSIGYLKPDRILHVNASDGFFFTSPIKSSNVQEEPKNMIQTSLRVQDPEIIDVSELMKDLEDEEIDFDCKENIRPQVTVDLRIDSEIESQRSGNLEASGLLKLREDDRKQTPLSDIDVSSFRPPDLNSGTLFDPNLLAAFEKAVMEVKAQESERRARIEQSINENIEEEPPLKARRIEEETKSNPLLDFQEKCPPGGDDSVILYTTGLRGIRKTFEDCNKVRFLLESFRLLIQERDVSMHLEFREEMWRTLEGKVVPPRLFIKGRYIGGAEEVLTLHEQGKLRPLLEGVPIDRSEGPCDGCAGVRFVVCFKCNGSQKIVLDKDGMSMKCPECNENGVIVCPICC